MTAEYSGAGLAGLQAIRTCLELGLTDVVVCPGSRSQALALAAAQAERSGLLRLHVAVDERSAGFYALGVSRETHRPTAVIVTSGSAVGNLLPAVMEAAAARVPLLLLTADRPPELHNRRANQTTKQAGVFELFATAQAHLDIPSLLSLDSPCLQELQQTTRTLWQASLGAPQAGAAGPAHLNLGLRDPLALTQNAQLVEQFLTVTPQSLTATAETAAAAAITPTYTLENPAGTVVLAGCDAGSAAENFAHRAQLPLLAEAVSGARYGRCAISCYQTLLADADTRGQIREVIVFGHPTLTREAQALVNNPAVAVTVVDPHTGESYGPAHATRVAAVNLSDAYDTAQARNWLRMWVAADRELLAARSTAHEPDWELARSNGYKERNLYVRQELAVQREPLTRELLAESVWRASWPHDRLVVAASRMVRVLDRVACPRPVPIHANRGVAGIDGTIATALGIAAASQAHTLGTTRVLLGDLALLHDAGSLALTPGEPQPRVQLFVANDCGGSIFAGLEVRKAASDADFQRVVTTPHRVEIAQLAAAYGWEYQQLTTRGELAKALTTPATRCQLFEIRLD